MDHVTLWIGAIVAAALLYGVWRAASGAARSAAETAALTRQLAELGAAQHRLQGGLSAVGEAQAAAQAQTLRVMETRLEEVSRRVGDGLHGAASNTARSLGEVQARLEAVDRAQVKIERLSENVLGLQDILSNKQARGAFGEIQLNDLVARALPPDAFAMQATLSNGKRVDCLIHTPPPTGAIPVDAKFPLEAYARLVKASDDAGRKAAMKSFQGDVLRHLRAIAERYLIEGETAESALMFLPSEAIYAAIHADFPDIVTESHALRVWIVSPSTLMATLTTLRAVLRDQKMRDQAGAVRRELGLLGKDIARLSGRIANLETHLSQTENDLREIGISADKIARRSRRLEVLEFDGETEA